MNAPIIVVATIAVLSLGTLLFRVIKRKKQHPAGPDQAAAHPLNAAGIAPASGTKIDATPTINPAPAITGAPTPQIITRQSEVGSDMPAHHPPPPPDLLSTTAQPPAGPEFEVEPAAAAPATPPTEAVAPTPSVPVQPAPSTDNSLLGGLPEMHKPGDVFHPESSDQKPN